MHRAWHLHYPAAWIGIIWLAWLVSWWAAAAWSNRTVRRPGLRREWPYRLIALAGVVVLGAGPRHAYRTPFLLQWIGVGLIVAGIAFAWWARIYLGRLWSASVTRKEGHRIVETGPYGLVRHPIYTGLLTSVAASALARGDAQGWVGAALTLVALWMKARLEEGFLRSELGAAEYDAYAARVPMLLPFGPR